VQVMKLKILKKILLIKMVISKETILAKGYKLPLSGFQLFGVSTPYIIP
jgi:hypothetical protein